MAEDYYDLGLEIDELEDEEDLEESLDGVSRVEDLENALSSLIDLVDREMLIVNPEYAVDGPEILSTIEKAYGVLAAYEIGDTN